MKNRYGQAALEFLTTYGWAFLVILVMIGGLSYFGVLDVSQFVPETCKLDGKIECGESFSVSASAIDLQIMNNLQKDVNIKGIKIWERDIDKADACEATSTDVDISSRRDDDVTFTLDSADVADGCGIFDNVGRKKQFNVEVTYVIDGSTIDSIAPGSVAAVVR